ncbi:MAG TPA: hypothetical protein VN843_15175, partial [Anaerolineales bacterium]|nr:hypothetical protein [Anaerolineales bacterium]
MPYPLLVLFNEKPTTLKTNRYLKSEPCALIHPSLKGSVVFPWQATRQDHAQLVATNCGFDMALLVLRLTKGIFNGVGTHLLKGRDEAVVS